MNVNQIPYTSSEFHQNENGKGFPPVHVTVPKMLCERDENEAGTDLGTAVALNVLILCLISLCGVLFFIPLFQEIELLPFPALCPASSASALLC